MKPIPGFSGYFCTEDGIILSEKKGDLRPIKYTIGHNGYYWCSLYRNGISKAMRVNRLVAITYLENDNPAKKIQVHHKDANKVNNHYSNLEWVTPSHNIRETYKAGRKERPKHTYFKGRENPQVRLIKQYHLEDGLVAVHWGMEDAERNTGARQEHISKCCAGKLKTTMGFIWKQV